MLRAPQSAPGLPQAPAGGAQRPAQPQLLRLPGPHHPPRSSLALYGGGCQLERRASWESKETKFGKLIQAWTGDEREIGGWTQLESGESSTRLLQKGATVTALAGNYRLVVSVDSTLWPEVPFILQAYSLDKINLESNQTFGIGLSSDNT